MLNKLGPDLTLGLFILGSWVGLFLLFRVAVLWYWKVDKIVALLEKILAQLDERA